MIQAIIFDFDGVLVDSEPLHYRAFLRILEPLGVTFDYPRYLSDYVGYDDRDFFRAIFGDFKLNFTAADLPNLIERKAEAFEHIVSEGVRALPGVVKLIEEATEVMPIAICSGALKRDIELILPRLSHSGQLAGMFRTIVSADMVSKSKPDPESYRLAAQRLNIAPSQCLAIEDTPAGLQSARGAGLRTLGVAQSLGAEKLAMADRVLTTLEGVTVEKLRSWFG